jgi:hypothetical protein
LCFSNHPQVHSGRGGVINDQTWSKLTGFENKLR